MYTIHIDHKKANSILEAALQEHTNLEDKTSRQIKNVLLGNHKTYKYILVNGLLAKATNEKCNPIALQAGAEIDGAFDARSLCHSVLVPFERKHLTNVLGGSNEPFLNKPARFKTLSDSNAVRNGNDRTTLLTLISIFNSIKDPEAAYIYLSYAMGVLLMNADRIAKLNTISFAGDFTLYEVDKYVELFITKSYEGESAVIIVSAMEYLLYRENPSYLIMPHKVNQSGASSKEISDIDIYYKGLAENFIEVKDKSFTCYDIEHAAKKVINGNGQKLLFIYGPNARFNEKEVASFIKGFNTQNNFLIVCQDLREYLQLMFQKVPLIDPSDLFKEMMKVAIQINSKEDTRKWIQECIDFLKH